MSLSTSGVTAGRRSVGRTILGRSSTGVIPDRILPLLTIIVVGLAWELFARGSMAEGEFPRLGDVIQALANLIGSSEFWSTVAATLGAWAAGFAIAVVLAVPAGLIIGVSTPVFQSLRLVIDFLRPIPPVAIIPLAVLVLGTGPSMRIWLVAFSAFWPILFQTLYGARDIDPVARDMARAYGLGTLRQFRSIVLPGTMPYIMTGVRLAVTIALVVEIAVELLAGSQGIGYAMNQALTASDVPQAYALLLVSGILGFAVAVIARLVERRVLHWHVSQRERVTA